MSPPAPPPDLWFIGGPWWIQIKRKKVALSISEFLANDPDVVMDDFEFPADSDWGMLDGDIYGLPTNSVILRGLAYSEDRFAEAGLDLPNDEWTFADVAAAGPQLNRGEESYAMTAPLLAGDLYLTTIWQNGGQIISEDETKCLLDQPEAVEAVEQLVAWTEFSMKPGQHAALGDFPTASGKIAMWPMVLADWDTWLKVTANDETNQWMTWWPSLTNPPVRNVYAGSVHMEAIWSQSENIDAAWEFFIWRAINQDSLDYQITLFPIKLSHGRDGQERHHQRTPGRLPDTSPADHRSLHRRILGPQYHRDPERLPLLSMSLPSWARRPARKRWNPPLLRST